MVETVAGEGVILDVDGLCLPQKPRSIAAEVAELERQLQMARNTIVTRDGELRVLRSEVDFVKGQRDAAVADAEVADSRRDYWRDQLMRIPGWVRALFGVI